MMLENLAHAAPLHVDTHHRSRGGHHLCTKEVGDITSVCT